MTRQTFTMTQEDYDEIIAKIQRAKDAPLIMLQCGMPPSIQEVANNAWAALGAKMGFDGMTVKPGNSELSFTAEPVEVKVES